MNGTGGLYLAACIAVYWFFCIIFVTMILIVDDDTAILASLRLLLERQHYNVVAVSGPEEAMRVVRGEEPELVLLDMNFSRGTSGDDGLVLLKQIRIFRPAVPVILMTAWANIGLVVEGMRAGASDFIAKPWDNVMLLEHIRALLVNQASDSAGFDRSLIVGESPRILGVIDTLRRVSATNAPVLIMGENGTGKELVAETIHRNSLRRAKPFVKVNLGGVPSSLFESEMFGHRKGAFTGAVDNRKGRFEVADAGTIFLDEIGELDPVSQVKMLRVLQEHTFEPLGSSTPRHVDVRVVSATNANLPAMVASGEFREDLFFRLNLITVTIPPLRERPGDIPLLVERFVDGRAVFEPQAMELLQGLDYPGNVRQLKNLIERVMIMRGDGCRVTADELAVLVDEPSAAVANIDANERALIVKALKACDGNISRAAASLGITRQALYRRIDKYRIPY